MSPASPEQFRPGRGKSAIFGMGLVIALSATLPAASQTLSSREDYCRQLEQELASDWMAGSRSRQNLPKIEDEIRKQDRIFNREQARAQRSDCYESLFIFGRKLKRTRKCLTIHRKIEDSRRRLTQLQEEKDAITRARGGNRRQDSLIDALARAGCGQYYQREASRRRERFFPFGNDGLFSSRRPRYQEREPSTILPFATYRTMCVRLCDGFYYPVSFSTLPSRFRQDADACQTNCAAPAELFVHRNPGEDVEQMISLDGRPYGTLSNAWRYRSEFIKGCSCKQAEYSPLDTPESEIPGDSPRETKRDLKKHSGIEGGSAPTPKVAKRKSSAR